ncbi:MAG: ABC transporter permease [Deltaproteobacteria bacterium]|nr:MAG: ABC transporter permease [Deltaproteobacteria bacterium]
MSNPVAKHIFLSLTRRWIFFFLAIEIIFFSIVGTNYFSLNNLQNILLASTTVLLLATGETFVIITGGIDLSVGFVVGLSSVICAKVMVDLEAAGLSQALAISSGILIALLLGLLPGLVNGLLVARLKVPPFVATFGMYGIAYGFAEIICKNVPIHNLPTSVGSLGHGYLFYWLPGKAFSFFSKPENLTRLELTNLVSIIPNVTMITCVAIGIFAFILAKTRFGQHTYAIGGSMTAAERAGVNIKSHLVKVYMISSFFASLAGVMYVLRFITGRAPAGSARLLDAVVAVVIGGASLYGGTGTILGTVFGALIIGTLEIGLVNLSIPTYNLHIAVGCILILAVLVDQFSPELVRRED